MRKYSSVLIIFILSIYNLNAQGVYSSTDPDYTHLIQRYQILNQKNDTSIHTSFKPYKRKDIAETLKNDSLYKSKSDKYNRDYLINDNHEWLDDSIGNSDKALFKHFYKKKANAYFFKFGEDFEIHADPILDVSVGTEKRDYYFNQSESNNLYRNTRGASIRGMINKKVGFFTSITENQVRFPGYVNNYIGDIRAIPGVGFRKNFGSGGYDYFIARGYITANVTKNISLQFGQDQNFIGDGYRSLILSDFATPYLFLKAETQVWKIKYTNLFAQLYADNRTVNGIYPKKYMAMHQLSMNIGKRLNIGLFETVMFARNDSSGNSNGFDPAYLNPIIFYRAIEQNLGSPDNVTVGLNWRLFFAKKFSFYGQFILDELIVSNLRAGNGWWGNKFGIQSGLKYIDAFGIKNLDLQGEFNAVRPYTYTHFSNSSNYQHFRQPLAHPLGANFYELISIIRYQPIPKVNLQLRTMYAKIGRDLDWRGLSYTRRDDLTNVGQDVNELYTTRIKDFGNKIGQGFGESIITSNFVATYSLKHNLFIDLNYTFRYASFNESDLLIDPRVDPNYVPQYNISNSHIFGLGLRWNAFLSRNDF